MRRLKEFVKKNKFVYQLYFCIGSLLVNLLKLFVKTDDRLILFVCYGGRHYSESPRVIYEAMLADDRFKEYRLVWAFDDPEKYNLPYAIKIDSLKYYMTALKARCWVTNVMIERALNFTGKHTFYLFTTHTILVKYDGPDLKEKDSKKFTSLARHRYDCCLAQSEFEKKIAMRMFGLDETKISVVGFPKNDVLINYTEEYRSNLRKKLNIPENKKAILYAPTFREDNGLLEAFNMNITKWKECLEENYVLLYRAHPVVDNSVKSNDTFFYDMTQYEVVEDLMIASDLLISDYSGLIFDYCLMHKPIYLWTYDYEEYKNERGLYIELKDELPCLNSEDELINMIYKHDWSVEQLESVNLQKKYETEFGHATEKTLDIIWKNIN